MRNYNQFCLKGNIDFSKMFKLPILLVYILLDIILENSSKFFLRFNIEVLFKLVF